MGRSFGLLRGKEAHHDTNPQATTLQSRSTQKKKKTRDVANYRVPSTELLVARLEYRMATTFLAAQAHDEDSKERQWST
jgi:hypothetical protein